jgi:hypothetical protein
MDCSRKTLLNLASGMALQKPKAKHMKTKNFRVFSCYEFMKNRKVHGAVYHLQEQFAPEGK